jgi:hypothetical protein
VRFYARLRRAEGHVVLSACDENLMGKEFREGEVVLRITSSYYGDELVDEETLKHYLSEATIIGLTGERAISVAAALGLCKLSDARLVEGVPHLNIYYI